MGYWSNRLNSISGINNGDNFKYYSADVGNWHIISLNSQLSSSERNNQVRPWLIQDLANTNKPCILAFWHYPRFGSSSGRGDKSSMSVYWDQLVDAKVDIVLNGHDHSYERFVPMDKNGNADPNGVTEFVVGTGGKSLYSFGSIRSNSATHYKGYGVLKLLLYPNRYEWEFFSTSGSYSDSGSGTCNPK